MIDLSTAQPIVVQSNHNEMNITQLKWRQNECQFFIGDTSGNVALVNLNNFLVKFMEHSKNVENVKGSRI